MGNRSSLPQTQMRTVCPHDTIFRAQKQIYKEFKKSRIIYKPPFESCVWYDNDLLFTPEFCKKLIKYDPHAY